MYVAFPMRSRRAEALRRHFSPSGDCGEPAVKFVSDRYEERQFYLRRANDIVYVAR